LIRALDLDLPEPRLVPVNPKNWAGATARTLPALISAKDFRLVLTPEPHEVPASQAIPLGSLVVEEKDGALVLRTRDGRISYDIIEAFGTALSSVIGNYFHLLAAESHTPRVTIDRVTVCRETWRFSPAELSFAFEKDESARFLAARRFARSHDLPRFVFIKVPIEVKPFYVDFDSPDLRRPPGEVDPADEREGKSGRLSECDGDASDERTRRGCRTRKGSTTRASFASSPSIYRNEFPIQMPYSAFLCATFVFSVSLW
jgi:hypothetical protein